MIDTEIEEYKFHQNKSTILINDIDINKIGVPNKLLFSNQDFKNSIGDKDVEKIRRLCIFCPEMIKYKINFYKNRRIYFIIKEEKVYDKFVESLVKVRNIIKKINSELIYSKNYLTVEKKINTKEGFQ